LVTIFVFDSPVEAHVVPLLVNTFPLEPGATNKTPLAPFPSTTLFAVNDDCPVPPFATGATPDNSEAASTVDAADKTPEDIFTNPVPVALLKDFPVVPENKEISPSTEEACPVVFVSN
jgi:hypothetical protein